MNTNVTEAPAGPLRYAPPGLETTPEEHEQQEAAGTKYCIMSHNRSLPENLNHFGRMVRKNLAYAADAGRATDVDWLLGLSRGRYDTIWWTVPEDMEPGGILFIHLRELAGGPPGGARPAPGSRS